MIAVYTNFAVIAVYTNILVSPIGRTAPLRRRGTELAALIEIPGPWAVAWPKPPATWIGLRS